MICSFLLQEQVLYCKFATRLMIFTKKTTPLSTQIAKYDSPTRNKRPLHQTDASSDFLTIVRFLCFLTQSRTVQWFAKLGADCQARVVPGRFPKIITALNFLRRVQVFLRACRLDSDDIHRPRRCAVLCHPEPRKGAHWNASSARLQDRIQVPGAKGGRKRLRWAAASRARYDRKRPVQRSKWLCDPLLV